MQGSLRRRLATAVQWYQALISATDDYVHQCLKQVRLQLKPSDHHDEHVQNREHNLHQPSDYLRAQCPLCFGGRNHHNPKMTYVSIF